MNSGGLTVRGIKGTRRCYVTWYSDGTQPVKYTCVGGERGGGEGGEGEGEWWEGIVLFVNIFTYIYSRSSL